MDPERTPSDSTVSCFITHFIRGRNLLLTRGSIKPISDAYERHREHHGITVPQEAVDGLFREALAAFTLHTASRPRRQVLAWTLNFQQPLCNLFFCGDTDEDNVAGRFFTTEVAKAERNRFYQELSDRGKPIYRSYVDFLENNPLLAAEAFYARSEQRPARFFQLSEFEFALLTAHPDWDQAWFEKVRTEEIAHLDEQAGLQLIEKRALRWHCGCNTHKVLRTLKPVFETQAEALFDNEDCISVHCPRCSALYPVTRETMETFIRGRPANYDEH